jgi:quercetin dioxygenase-like cupin family protein
MDMSEVQPQPYQAKKISVIARGADVLVREYVLDPGEFIPWHHHTQVTDHYYSLEGMLLIETRIPAARHELNPGESATVTPPTAHHVSNPSGNQCRFLLIQGVGKYDFVKEE